MSIRIEKVSKRFGRTVALDSVSLSVEKGEMFAILGPSGSGKTTLLRIIAGFEVPDEGRVYFDGEDVTFLEASKRGAVMVFQNWALWPHMTVYDNIAYGLKIRKVPENVIREKVKWVTELLGIRGLESRYPHQLSGGQQQRVALARALVVEPRVLLLDEPLSNLDAKLRLRLRGELRKLQKKLGITSIYVTHDQEEALALADRIAVLRAGKLEQVGSPRELYTKPETLFTAAFLGKTSIAFGVVVDQEGDYAIVRVGEVLVRARAHKLSIGDHAVIVFKSETASLKPLPGGISVEGLVTVKMYLGSVVEVRLAIPGSRDEIAVYIPMAEGEPPEPGNLLRVYFPLPAVHAFPHDEDVVKELIE